MTIHAKLLSETSIDRNPPRSAVIDGAFVCGTLPEPYLNSQGWYRLVETPMPTARDGYHYEFRFAYDDESAPTAILKNWIEVQNPPDPPRSLSKVKLMRALKERQLWAAVKAFIQSNENLADEWELSTTLDEDHDLVKNAVGALRTQLEIPEQTIKEILAESVAG